MKFSVIIPTMWKSNKIFSSIEELIKCDLIHEIIIINNEKTFILDEIFQNEKIKMFTPENNIYVNPSWNKGVEMSTQENLIFLNDDVFIKNMCELINEVSKTKYDMVGFDVDNSNKLKTITINDYHGEKQRPPKFATCFFLRKNKYVKIPKEILIWCGDGIQYTSNYNRGIFTVPEVDFEMSTTCKTIENRGWILHQNDRPLYKKYCEINNLIPF